MNYKVSDYFCTLEKKKKKTVAHKLRNGHESGFGQGLVNSVGRGKKKIFRKPGCWAPWLSLVTGSLTTESLKPAD